MRFPTTHHALQHCTAYALQHLLQRSQGIIALIRNEQANSRIRALSRSAMAPDAVLKAQRALERAQSTCWMKIDAVAELFASGDMPAMHCVSFGHVATDCTT